MKSSNNYFPLTHLAMMIHMALPNNIWMSLRKRNSFKRWEIASDPNNEGLRCNIYENSKKIVSLINEIRPIEKNKHNEIKIINFGFELSFPNSRAREISLKEKT